MSQPQYTAPQLRAIITSAAGYDGWVEELARLARDHGLFDGLVDENGLPRRARLEGWHNELQTYTNEQRLDLNESLRKLFMRRASHITMLGSESAAGILRARPWRHSHTPLTQEQTPTPPHLHGPKRGLIPLHLHPLDPSHPRDGWLFVPQTLPLDNPSPLLVLFHGAGADGRQMTDMFSSLATDHGCILLAPDSHASSWDVISRGGFGADVDYVDHALGRVFEGYDVDSSRIAIGGFSDGASYAISLGLNNGDLFRHVLAFSPGFMAPTRVHGSPRFFITHGVGDGVLSIDRCSRRLVPRLQKQNLAVQYEEFEGGHTVPRDVARKAIQWFLADSMHLSDV